MEAPEVWNLQGSEGVVFPRHKVVYTYHRHVRTGTHKEHNCVHTFDYTSLGGLTDGNCPRIRSFDPDNGHPISNCNSTHY